VNFDPGAKVAGVIASGGAMKRSIATCAVAALVLAATVALAQRSATARETKTDELKARLDKGEKVLVIDVRSDEEIKTGSIPGAVHIPMEQLEARMKDVPRDVQLVFT
jgi:predicted sulfurtransferase